MGRRTFKSICTICKKEFDCQTRYTGKYCSHKCQTQSLKGRIISKYQREKIVHGMKNSNKLYKHHGIILTKEKNKRICKECKLLKKLEDFREFYNVKSGRYYRIYRCRKCDTKRVYQYRKDHPEWTKVQMAKNYNGWKLKIIGDKCLICEEFRTLDIAHIVARNGKNGKIRQAWYNQKDNLLGLCPTHHRLFDENKLTKEEYAKIKDKVEFAKKKYGIS